MSAVAALAGLRKAGIQVGLRMDGTVQIEADAPPPPALLEAARPYRESIAWLLKIEAGEAVARLPSAKRAASWSDPTAIPQLGWWCGCCHGHQWWAERDQAQGWRCATCHPPDHLPAAAVRHVATAIIREQEAP